MKLMRAGVRIEHVEISVLPLAEQLELISQATVLVSNIGSRSFRLIYLPNGATTILVGPPECATYIKLKLKFDCNCSNCSKWTVHRTCKR